MSKKKKNMPVRTERFRLNDVGRSSVTMNVSTIRHGTVWQPGDRFRDRVYTGHIGFIVGHVDRILINGKPSAEADCWRRIGKHLLAVVFTNFAYTPDDVTWVFADDIEPILTTEIVHAFRTGVGFVD